MGNECCESANNKVGSINRNFKYNYVFQEDSEETSQPIFRTSTYVTHTPPSDYEQKQTCEAPKVNSIIKTQLSKQLISKLKTGQAYHGVDDSQYYLFKRSGAIYCGEWKNQVPHGAGVMYMQKGNVYQGMFYEGVPFGFGRLIMVSGALYEGEIRYGKANGEGIYTLQNFTYRGNFKDDLKHGQGEQKQQGQYYFKGIYQNGEKIKGTYKYEGNLYNGQFQNDEFNGLGELKNADGSIYKGSFRNGRFHGYGQFKWEDGSQYRGNYVSGDREGDGQFFNSKNSSISKGIWKNGSLTGEGQYRDYRGKVTKCIWQNGKMTGIKTK